MELTEKNKSTEEIMKKTKAPLSFLNKAQLFFPCIISNSGANQ